MNIDHDGIIWSLLHCIGPAGNNKQYYSYASHMASAISGAHNKKEQSTPIVGRSELCLIYAQNTVHIWRLLSKLHHTTSCNAFKQYVTPSCGNMYPC